MTMDRHARLDDGGGASHGRLAPDSDAVVTDDELLGLSEDPDGVVTLLNFLCAKLRDDGEAGPVRRLPLGSVGPIGRQLLARHFDPQRFADIAGDPHQPRWHRLMALRVIEMGVTEWRHLEVDDTAVMLSEVAYLLVASLKDRGAAAEAAATLQLFTGCDSRQSRLLVEQAIAADDVRAAADRWGLRESDAA